jgi:hypothetical protein
VEQLIRVAWRKGKSNMTKGKATIRPTGKIRSTTGKKKICHNCGSEATQIASFDIHQATLVEYYCEEHIKLVKGGQSNFISLL